MKKIIGFIIAALLFVLLILGASTAYRKLTEQYSPGSVQMNIAGDAAAKDTTEADAQEDEKFAAPDFTVTDPDGNSVNLSDFAGKPVVVNFWATWCGPCKTELPAFDDAWKEYGEDVVFMMVNLTDDHDTPETADAFVEENGYKFPLYYDTEHDASYTYGIYSIPVTLFVDAEGYLDAGYIGALNEEIINTHIEQLLGE